MSSDLGAVAKDMASAVARGAEKGGKAIVEHYKSIGKGLLKSSALHKDVENDIQKNAENIGKDVGKDVEKDARQEGETAAKDAKKSLATRIKNGLNRVFHRKGAHDDVGSRPSGADPVDLATGDVLLDETDVSLPGVLPLVLERAHRSSMDTGRWFGPSWMSSLDQRLLVTSERIIGAFDGGRVLTWTYPIGSGDAAVDAATGPQWQLRRHPGNSYTVHDPQQGLTWRFESRDGYEAYDEDDADEGDAELPLISITDRIGHEITFQYDDRGRPLSVTHSGGYRVLVSTDGDRVTGLALAGPDDVPLRQFEYDTDGNLSAVINSSGLPQCFSYDDAGRMISWTDRNGHSYRYTYDDQGRCIRGDGPGGALSGTFAYEDGLTRYTDANGAVTTYEITDSGEIAAIIDPLGSITRWEYDARGRVITCIDPLGSITRYAHDDRGNMIAITRADGSQATAEYDERSLPTRVVSPDGTAWRQEHDERGNVTTLIAPDDSVTRYGYDDNGHLASVTDAVGAVTEVVCDPVGQPAQVDNPNGSRNRYTRDPFGRVIEVAGPGGAVTGLSWTPEGQLAELSFPDGSSENWSYDGEGNLISHLNVIGGNTTYEYGPFDHLTAITRPDGTRTQFEYDRQLQLTSVSQGGLLWRYTYDSAGMLVEEVDYNGTATAYRHDSAGQLVSQTNGAGQEIAFRYDSLGNLVERVADGILTTFAYDAEGRLVSAENPDADLRIERDALGRVIAETCNGRTVTSEYDPAGQLVRRVTPSGAVTDWAYDVSGLPTLMTTGGHRIRFGHDAAGQETHRDLPGQLTLAQDWDQRGRLTLQTLTNAGSTRSERPAQAQEALLRRAYNYRQDGLVDRVEDLIAGNRMIDLDPTGRITAVTGQNWSEQYAYDQAGTVSSASLPAPSSTPPVSWPGSEAQGQREITGTLVKRAGNIRYRYDRQGRIIQRQRIRLSRRPDTWRYEWDSDDGLSAIPPPKRTPSSSSTLSSTI